MLYCTRPENVPRLFDLVKPKDNKYITAFYFALRNTLVADSLEQATRIGLQVSRGSCNGGRGVQDVMTMSAE